MMGVVLGLPAANSILGTATGAPRPPSSISAKAIRISICFTGVSSYALLVSRNILFYYHRMKAAWKASSKKRKELVEFLTGSTEGADNEHHGQSSLTISPAD